ncbi:Alpha/Beta hydrolase protein [Aspergillus pseudonomiae]|uniref:Alpha/Beta hydrolase protein n=1 Tax=Aspergillus pseudonomiae TaxID=1506151 RepID=A0A5N6IB85_9EURO|nr:Alpha/Beta hydrolase protein [Aspergillus pseudonomiae]KAB8263050.1 Alpha/Beta hydrolase protein [Aspergillus pseudonomiae]KAE8408702.1 Alpha/Beta hydrolase protein [Aspergillus pseudonomiae]
MAYLIFTLLFFSAVTFRNSLSLAQSQGLRTLSSSYIDGASLSYKKTPICSIPDLDTYSGYVHLPPRVDDAHPHPRNLFFYYAKSTKNRTAPLTIYLGGGPGASSMSSMATEIGPCSVNSDSNSTSPNPWSWTRESDILFIDQPVQTGFSYDVLTNATIDYLTSIITPTDFHNEVPAANHTFRSGVFGSQNFNGTVNSTMNGARALWDFMQVWINEFPEYESPDKKVHIWTESFGGRYGPSYAAYFLDQNEKVQNNQRTNASSPSSINIDTLSIHNGCSDIITQGAFYPIFAYNNTYGAQAINKEQYEEANYNLTKPGGCMDMAVKCQELAQRLDPHNLGNNADVNAACFAADEFCYANVLGVYALSGRDVHDLAEVPTSTMPQPYSDGFFNRPWVQDALGARVNFTANSNVVYNAFWSTGNALITRGNAMDDFASIVKRGVKVNLIYGDRDYLCNWMGGENISLSIKHDQSAAFSSSGYADLITNRTYVGGVVRQHGNLSFTRVFDSGHAAAAFQPETMFRIFSRIIHSKDIATGNISMSEERRKTYKTHGPHSSLYRKNKLPSPAAPVCYTLDMSTTCTANQKVALMNGTAVVEDFVVKWPVS